MSPADAQKPWGRWEDLDAANVTIWRPAVDLVCSVHWGELDEAGASDMVAVLELFDDLELGPTGRILMDCRDVVRVDVDGALDLTAHARGRAPGWRSAVEHHAVLVPAGVPGILLAGTLSSLSPSNPIRFFEDVDEALAFVDHPDARIAHAEAVRLSAPARAQPALLRELRAHLSIDLMTASIARSAAALGRSTRSLQRELRRLGTSFRAQLCEARLAAAEELVRRVDVEFADIAAAIGFSSTTKMSTAMYRKLGVKARELRRRCTSGSH